MPVSAQRIVPFPSRPKPNANSIQRPRPSRRPWLRAAVLLVTAIYLVWAGSQLVSQELRMRQLRAQYDELAVAQEELQAANDELQRKIESLNSDPDFLEQLARSMGMVKPNDTIYLPATTNR